MRENETKNHNPVRRTVWLLAIAAILLANPVWCLTDLLPDLIAWLIIWMALRGFAEHSGSMETARKWALWLIGIEGLKSLIWLLLQNPSSLQGAAVSSNRLLATTAFCIVEVACMLLFFRSFLNGAEAFARAGNGDTMYRKVEDIHFLCKLFVLARAGCTLIPELTAIADVYLMNPQQTDTRWYPIVQQLAESGELFTVLFSLIELIVAGIWLASFLPFLRQFDKDHSLHEHINALLTNQNARLTANRHLSRFRAARVCFAVGLACLSDIHIDGVGILPFWAFPVLFAGGCVFLNRIEERKPFRHPAYLALTAGLLLLGAECYRSMLRTWDVHVFAEISVTTELLYALWMLVSMPLLLGFWLQFAKQMDQTCQTWSCGNLFFSGLPYVLLSLCILLQATMFCLPLASSYCNAARLLVVIAFWILANRRLAALEEQFCEALSLGVQNKPE